MIFLYKFCYLRIKKILLFSLSVVEYLQLKKNHLLRLLRLRTGATTAVSSAKAFRTSGGLPPLSIGDFKYGPSVFKNNSRSYLFNRSKSIKEAIKECEDDIFGPYGVRKMHNKNFDNPHFMEYYLDYKCFVYK